MTLAEDGSVQLVGVGAGEGVVDQDGRGLTECQRHRKPHGAQSDASSALAATTDPRHGIGGIATKKCMIRVALILSHGGTALLQPTQQESRRLTRRARTSDL